MWDVDSASVQEGSAVDTRLHLLRLDHSGHQCHREQDGGMVRSGEAVLRDVASDEIEQAAYRWPEGASA